MIRIKYSIEFYRKLNGDIPFDNWLKKLDVKIQQRIEARILRATTGNLGDIKSLKDGLYEMRFHYGSGYRIYFGIERKTILIILIGGDKNSQTKDILKVQHYWKDYLERDSNG